MDASNAPPSLIAAGTTVVYTVSSFLYPATDGWTLKLVVRGKAALDVTAAASGADYLLTIKASQSALLDAGRYSWAHMVSRVIAGSSPPESEVYPLQRGALWIDPDLMTAVAGDLQTHDEKLLALLKTEQLRRATDGSIESYQQTSAGGGFAATLRPDDSLDRRVQQLEARIAMRRRGTPFVSVRANVAPRRSRA